MKADQVALAARRLRSWGWNVETVRERLADIRRDARHYKRQWREAHEGARSSRWTYRYLAVAQYERHRAMLGVLLAAESR